MASTQAGPRRKLPIQKFLGIALDPSEKLIQPLDMLDLRFVRHALERTYEHNDVNAGMSQVRDRSKEAHIQLM